MEQEKPVREERLLKGLGRYREMLTKRASRIPLQQILGNASFMGLTFSVNEHVLIPRQDTEVLAEQVLTDYRGRDITVLDVCTGSGCIAISLAVLGKYRIVCGTDISREALAVANRNARNLFLGQKGVLKGTADHVCDSPWRTDFSVMTEKGERMTRGQVYGIVRANLSLVTTLKKRSPHVLRHSFATAMLNNGAGLESVKKLLGHESLETTEIYTHTTFEQLKRVYKEAHPRA